MQSPDLSPLDELLDNADLRATYSRFLALTGGPSDGRCLAYVAAQLKTAFQAEFEQKPFWSTIDPFEGWEELANLVVAHEEEFPEKLQEHMRPKKKTIHVAGEEQPVNPMYGAIDRHPLYAMLCDTQETQKQRVPYASLQLHVLYGRWLQWKKEAEFQTIDPFDLIRQEWANPSERVLRHPHSVALAVRNISLRNFSGLLDYLDPCRPPEKFRQGFDETKRPIGAGIERCIGTIRSFCFNDHGKYDNRGGGSGERGSVFRWFTEYVNYGSNYIGVPLGTGEGDGESATSQEAVSERTHTDEDALKLGLHPLEVAGGQTILRTSVEDAKSNQEGRELARSGARHFEIDRRLFPWTSSALRLEDFHRGLLPAIQAICLPKNQVDGCPVAVADAIDSDSRSEEIPEREIERQPESKKENDDLERAALVAIAIETGRIVEDILELRIEKKPNSVFVFQPPQTKGAFGTWYWKAIGPPYRTQFDVPAEKERDRANYLRYPASRLVTGLIERFRAKAKIRSGSKLFGAQIDYAKAAAQWIAGHDPTKNCTMHKLARLRWGILHRLTGGEIAHACLVLGVPDHQASVELHYAILDENEAARLFRESSHALWLDDENGFLLGPPAKPMEEGKIVGVRAFPRRKVIQEAVGWMSEGSQLFFQLHPRKFDAANQEHRELLNRAVLYAVWHQMYCFATRAICDAYQDLSVFAEENGVGTLSDKDFEDNHKTRLIWAEPRLLRHMAAIEKRLARLRDQLREVKFPDGDAPVWFLVSSRDAISITPSSLEAQLGERFPFEINIPRKVMRHLLSNEDGLTHEEAEVYMGHWWEGREPWSPFSSFRWDVYLEKLEALIPPILNNLGFTWVPGEKVTP